MNEIVVDGVKYVRAEPEATRVSIWGMYDMHLFHPIVGRTVDEVIANWRTHKAPMAAYWKAVAVYAGHTARICR